VSAHGVAHIDAIASGGAGVARIDGLVVFVPRTAPGDRVELTYRKRGRLGEGRLTSILEASPARTTPTCRHYDGDQCGGCQLQHLTYSAQLDAKRRIVRDAISRIGKRDVDVAPVVASPAEWRYRNRLTLAMRWRAGSWTFGLHRWDDVDRIFQLDECSITDDLVVAAWREVQGAASYLPRSPELRGSVRRVGDVCAFVLEGGSEWSSVHEFARRAPLLSVIRWHSDAGERRILVDRTTASVPSASFDQVNAHVAAMLQEHVFAAVIRTAPPVIVDAYSGTGVMAARFAATGAHVTAIELDREASAHAAKLLAPPSVAVCARVEDVLPRALPADVVILNPPRSGVEASVCDALQRVPQAPRLLLYVSCDPATLARDLTRLGRYRVESVTPFDMFPQTAHVETVCALVPEA
jgi:23S rRNA (uracil1939-C5)-methyltransferase